MQIVNVCMCMHTCVCECMWVGGRGGGGWGKRRIYDKIQNFDEFHVVSNIFGWLPVCSLRENSRHAGNAKTTFKNQKASKYFLLNCGINFALFT